jgi:hypothetical protein
MALLPLIFAFHKFPHSLLYPQSPLFFLFFSPNISDLLTKISYLGPNPLPQGQALVHAETTFLHAPMKSYVLQQENLGTENTGTQGLCMSFRSSTNPWKLFAKFGYHQIYFFT